MPKLGGFTLHVIYPTFVNGIWPSIFCIREGNLDQPYPRQVCWSFYPSPSPGRVQV